jgi:hypothetical protein
VKEIELITEHTAKQKTLIALKFLVISLTSLSNSDLTYKPKYKAAPKIMRTPSFPLVCVEKKFNKFR